MMRRNRMDSFTRFSYGCLYAAIGVAAIEAAWLIACYVHMVD